MQRFSGMVSEMASFLARRVFCLLPDDDPMDEACRRVSAREFGRWVKDLPRIMATQGPIGEPPALAEAEKILEEVQREEIASPISPSLPLSPTTSLLTQSLLQVLEQREAYAASGTAGPSSPAWRHRRGLSNASIGYSLSSVPQSRRPASRKASFSITEAAPMSTRMRTLDLMSAGPSSAAHSRAATPLLRGRTLSRLGSVGPDMRNPSGTDQVHMELSTVLDEGEGDMSMSSVHAAFLGLRLESIHQERESSEGHEKLDDVTTIDSQSIDHGQDQDGEDQESNSRSQSVVRKRKRGARKGKGQVILQQQQEIARLQQENIKMRMQMEHFQNQSTRPKDVVAPPSAPLPPIPVESADALTIATESLARELSRKSRSTNGHNHRGSSAAVSPGSSMLSLASSTNSHSRSMNMHPITNAREGAKAAGVAASSLIAAGGATPGAMFPVSFASGSQNRRGRGASPATSKSRNTLSSSSVNVSLDCVSASGSSMSVLPTPTINKKQSKWKLSFGKSSSQSRATLAQQDEVLDISRDGGERVETKSTKAEKQKDPKDTAYNYENILDGLSYTGFISAPSSSSPPQSSAQESWRGRKPPIPPKVQVAPFGSSIASGSGDRWPQSERNVSPNSTRTGRSVAGTSSGPGSSVSLSQSSMSSNWRNSTITTNSSASNSSASSAYTRYSNGSMRSVSTVATSVSGNSGSWRGERQPPPNVKSE